MPTSQGAIRLFRFAGIDVFLHWSWFVVALYLLQRCGGAPGAGVEPGPDQDVRSLPSLAEQRRSTRSRLPAGLDPRE